MITKAVIPAAGKGTRMAPLTDYLPKPMLPLGKKPVLQHIIEEIKEAGIDETGIVIHPNHQEITSYFSGDPSVTIIHDESTTGPGGAILKASEFIDDKPFLTIFSDAPVFGEGRGDYLQRLSELIGRGEEAGIAVYQIPPEEAARRGIVLLEDEGEPMRQPNHQELGAKVNDMLEKPSAAEITGPQWASACRYAGGPELLQALRESERDEKGELQLTDALRRLISRGRPVRALPLDTQLQRHDTGNFEGYFQALRALIE